MPKFANSVARVLDEKLGERISVLDFGAIPDGVADCSLAFSRAIEAADGVDGCVVYVPQGTYLLNSPVTIGAGVDNITIEGDGQGSVFKRGADMPVGQGMLDIAGTRITLANFAIEGMVLVPTGRQYGTFQGENGSDDPMHDLLTQNTSVWIQPGARDIRCDQLFVRHTGGYAILIDARTADVVGVTITDSLFEHNRPHLFGTDAGDLNYGSWTGGIHYQGDCRAAYGRLFAVKNMLVRNCTFRRSTGNQVWGHAYGFDALHANHRIEGCHFEDIGRDGVMCGALTGGAVRGNTFRRIGYIAVDDNSPTVPRYLAYHYAVGLDTAGLVRGVAYADNTFVSCLVGCMDLDGYADGVVSGNTCIVPRAGEPEYAEDAIASWPIGNWTYGIQVSNSNNLSAAAVGVNITGNRFVNCGGGAVRLYASRRCNVMGNVVEHSATADIAPFRLGNIGGGDNQRSYSNVVAENTVHYDPAAPIAAVQEDANGFAFHGADKNWVASNRLFGNCYEFLKDVNTSSTASGVYSSVGATSGRSESHLQREGTGAAAVLKLYSREGDGPGFGVGAWIDAGPVYNISADGLAGTGALTTGARTALAWYDCVATGKGVFDAFAAFTDTTFAAAQANVLDDSWGLLRYNRAARKFEMSVSVDGGARVWQDLVGGAAGVSSLNTLVGALTIQGTANEVDVSAAGSTITLGLPNQITVAGVAGEAAIVAAAGFIQAAGGVYTAATNVDAIQAPNGGVTARYLVGTESLTLATAAAGLSSTGQGRIRFNNNRFEVSENGGTYVSLVGGAPANMMDTNTYQLVVGKSFYTSPDGSVVKVASSGVVLAITTVAGYNRRSFTIHHDDQSKPLCQMYKYDGTGYQEFFTVNNNGVVYAQNFFQSVTGFYTTNTAPDAIQAPSGGVSAKYLIGTESMTLTTAAAAVSAADQGRIRFANNRFEVSENGGAYVPMLGGGTGNYVTLDTNQDISSVKTFTAGNAAIVLSSGWVQTAGGFLTTSTEDTAIQAQNGGLTANKVISKTAVYCGSTGANPGSGYGGIRYKTSDVYQFWTGTMWVDATMSWLSTPPGVASLNGMTGYMYVGGGSAGFGTELDITNKVVKVGKSTDNVTLNSLRLNSTAFNALELPNGYIQTKGIYADHNVYNSIQTDGGVSATLGYYMGTTAVINSLGQFVGLGIDIKTYGCGCAGVNIWDPAFGPSGGYRNGRSGTLVDLYGNSWTVRGGVLTVS
jgi:hypothetical protein